jgi:hypothetical protein
MFFKKKKKIKRKPIHQLGNQFMVTKIRKIRLYIFVVEKKKKKKMLNIHD